MKLLFEFFFLIKIIGSILSLCNITHPILKNDKCDSIYCSKEEFDSLKCKIDNPIIKTQWLTSLIPLSDLNFRYINPVLTKNNDLIIQTTKSTGSLERKFFGIKKNGRYYFNNSNGEEYPYFSINVINEGEDDSKYYMLQNVGSIIYLENDESDYFLSVGAYNTSYSELIDFKKKTLSRVLTTTLYKVRIYSEIGSIFELKSIKQKKYYILSFLTENSGKYYFMFKLHFFNSTFIENGNYIVTTKFRLISNNIKISSCFEAYSSTSIFCFFQNTDYSFTIYVYQSDVELEKKAETVIDTGSYAVGNENIFLKAIYLTQYAGFFIYYKSTSYTYPRVQIKEWDGDDDINNFNSFGIISLNKYSFNPNLHLNDVVKFQTNQICFSSSSPNKEILYIVIFNFYNNYSKFVIRYYKIKLYELYNKKILFELKVIQFNDYLSLSSSLCSSSDCDSNTDEHYSYLMIFGYPNSTDFNFDLIEHLLTTNETISNISINLFNSIKIENNIFGYIINGIKILTIPEKINVKSKLDGKEIYQNNSLIENETIIISISLDVPDIIEEYLIEYALTLSNPNYEKINDYITIIDKNYGDGNEERYYSSNEYIGRTSFFKIIKNNSLSSICQNVECSLCYQENNNICLTCQNEYIISNGNKICILPLTTLPIETTFPILTTLPIETTFPILTTLPIETTFPILTTLPIETTFPILATLPIETTFPIISTNIKTDEISSPKTENNEEECFNKDILLNHCDVKLTNEQIKDMYNQLSRKISDGNYTNENIILVANNIAFQLSTLEEQKNSDNPLVSNIDLGECEQLLRNQEQLSSEDELIVLKTDFKSEDYQKTYVQYEIYNPNSFKKINLTICQKVSISINTPIHLSSNLENLYDSLNKSGYNLFNSNDSFYNDICSPYTSEKGIDIPMADRQSEIYNNINNNTMCQEKCNFVYYNSTNKKALCDCQVQVEDTELDNNKINFKKEIIQTFFTTLNKSNFRILKCYKLVFSMKGQKGNIGSYILIIIGSAIIFLIFLYFIFENKKIHDFINQIIKQKIKSEPKKLNTINKSKRNHHLNLNKNTSNNNLIKSNTLKEKSNQIISKKNIKKKSNKKSKEKIIMKKNEPQKKISTNKKLSLSYNNLSDDIPNKKSSIILFNKGNKGNIDNKNETKNILPLKKNKKKKRSKRKKNIINNNVYIYNLRVPLSSSESIKKRKKIKKKKDKKDTVFNKNEIITLNDEELNSLDYETALNIDKRTYIQYYWSLLKKKQLILFTFLPSNDYNLISIKISLFLFSFGLYFTINGFFFTDKTMHNVYKNNGKLDIIYQIPQISYSSIITSVLNKILRILSLSEKSILDLKKSKSVSMCIKNSKNIEKSLKIKFIIFFILSFFLILFFWYFISCFCAVYKNTQIILIKDTLISFGLSMLYPFGLNLLPGIFRIPALRSKKENLKSLFNFSKIVAFI